MNKILPQQFYERDPKIVARELLGKILWRKTDRGIISGMIVETESYGGTDDPASHAYKKITPRNKVMFGPPGLAYVYFCYGMYYLFNIVTGKNGIPSAVLIRAIQPIEGIDLMKKVRHTSHIKDLANGPGKLTRAFFIDRSFNAKPVFSGYLLVKDNPIKPDIVRKKRIGIKLGADKLLRFYIKSNPYVSLP
ncbi:MAG: DNA-3-methyladenine glycosylase [Spirochaetes bacterium]|nr:DNA-3-methyladenine glycosylase [Spirochaetota bacterium]